MSDAKGGFKDTIELSVDGATNWTLLGHMKSAPSFPQSRGSIDASVTGQNFVDRIPGRWDNSPSYDCIDVPTDPGQILATTAAGGSGDTAKIWARLVRDGVPRRKARFIVLSADLSGDMDGTETITYQFESISAPSAA